MSDPLVVLCAMDWDNRWKRLVAEHLVALGMEEVLAEVMPDATGLVSERGARALDTARVAVLVVSPEFLNSRHMMRTVLHKLVLRASVVVRHGQAADAEFLPVVAGDCQWSHLPDLALAQLNHELQQPLEHRPARHVHRVLATIARRTYQHLQTIKALPAALAWPPLPAAVISLGPLAGDALVAEYQDREALVHKLNLAWMDAGPRVVNLVGEAGIGKTTLLAQWLRLMSRDQYRGAERVFAWSFQHHGDDPDVSEFLLRAGEFFGLVEDSSLARWEIGARLGRRIAEQRAILVLDGIDALVRANDDRQAVLQDEALLMLLRRLTVANRGLCVVASRQPLAELTLGKHKTVAVLPVEAFATDESVELLAKLHTPGDATALHGAAECALGHPQSLRALSAWLSSTYRRDTGRMGDFGHLFSVLARQRRAAILDHYLQSLGDGPEVQLLRLLAGMHRALRPGELAALLAGEPIAGFTDRVQMLKEEARRQATTRLRVAGLLQMPTAGTLEVHSLVREQLRRGLSIKLESSWRKLHSRLCEECRPPANEPLDDAAGVGEAIRAAQHGAASGEHASVFADLLEGRLWGTDDPPRFGPVRQMVARSRVFASLLDERTRLPRQDLSPDQRTLVGRRWRRGLRAIGCFAEATTATEAQLQEAQAAQDQELVAECLIELCDLLLWQGRLKEATRRVNELLALPGIQERRQHLRDAVNLSARVLHLKGQLQEARQRYQIVAKQPAAQSLLCGADWWHCEAILDSGNFPLAERIAWRQWELLADQKGLAAAGFSLVLTRLYQSLLRHSGDWRYREEALKHLKQAIGLSVRSGMTETILASQLAEASQRRTAGKFAEANELLTDVAALVTRMDLRLLAIDVHLEWAQLRLDQGRGQEVHDRLDQIRQQVLDHQYGRAGNDLAQIRQRIVVQPRAATKVASTHLASPPQVDTSGTNRQAVKKRERA